MPRGRRRTVQGRGVQALSAGTVGLSAMPGNPLLHFDSRTGVTFDPATERVSAWANLGSAGSSGNIAQTTASEQPLYKATDLGAGNPAILYDGSDDLLWGTNTTLDIQEWSCVVGYAYSSGASNYHQGGMGGNSISAVEGNSIAYFRGYGVQPVNPLNEVKGYQLYNGNLAGSNIGQNIRTSLGAQPANVTIAIGGSWYWTGSTNEKLASTDGSTTTVGSVTNDNDRDGTLQAFSVGRYTYGCLEGYILRAITWPRTLRQVELNRATRVLKGGM